MSKRKTKVKKENTKVSEAFNTPPADLAPAFSDLPVSIELEDFLTDLDIYLDIFYKNKKVMEILLKEDDNWEVGMFERDIANIVGTVVKEFKGKKISNYKKDISCKMRYELKDDNLFHKTVDNLYKEQEEIDNTCGNTKSDSGSSKCCGGGKCHSAKDLEKLAKTPGCLDILK